MMVKPMMTVAAADCRMKGLEDDSELLASGLRETNSMVLVLGVGISAKKQILLNYRFLINIRSDR